MTDPRSLAEQINELSPEKAQEAVHLFYQQLPASLWVNQKKLPEEDLEIQASFILQDASNEVKPLLKTLASDSDIELNGAVARAVLLECVQDDELVSYVQKAVQLANEPHMFEPISLGLLLIVLALIPKSIKVKTKNANVQIDLGNLDAVAKITDNFKQIFDKFSIPGK
jgi:hypothetical protein